MTANMLNSAGGHHVRVVAASKRYGAAAALDGVHIEARPGEFLVLLGPSGSGKSTLLRSLAGIERLDDGTIRLGDRIVSDRTSHVPPDRRDLGMVFQDYALWPHLTALGNVSYPLRRRRGADAKQDANRALRRVGLGDLAHRYPHELSGGEQQRVALARAVVARPRLLLFDEPLSNLDADLRERLRVEIATLTRETGATAVYITHDQSEAFALADRIAVLRAGRIEQVGAPEDVYHRPATPFVARFTGLAGELSGRATWSAGGDAVVRVGAHTLACRGIDALTVGATIRILVRPAATSLVPAHGATENAIPGIISDVAYRGRGYDHVIETDAGTLTSVFDVRPWSRGTTCLVRLDPTGCFAHQEGPVSRESVAAVRHTLDLTAVTLS